MNQIPNDIFITLLNILPITGKRNLFRCNKKMYQLHSLMGKYEKEFNDMINNEKYLGQNITLLELEKYTLEIVYDGFINLMPKKYFIENNKILYDFPELYFNCAKRNLFDMSKILIEYNKKYGMKITN